MCGFTNHFMSVIHAQSFGRRSVAYSADIFHILVA